jgi:hypothetical protein
VAAAGAAVACPACAGRDVKRKLSLFAMKSEAGFLPSAMHSGGS